LYGGAAGVREKANLKALLIAGVKSDLDMWYLD
jgi:hypothetical protein